MTPVDLDIISILMQDRDWLTVIFCQGGQEPADIDNIDIYMADL